jgi:ribosomal-protein-alanine N-acetyltransferase
MNSVKKMDIVIEEATEKELNRILEIEKVSFSNPWSRQIFSIELHDNEFSRIIYARVKDKERDRFVLGYCCYWFVSDEIHITNIAVHPGFRRKGIGERLLQYVLNEASHKKTRLITLEVRMSNKNAKAMYQKLGFQSIAVRKKYYPDNEDALVMLLKLESCP